MSCVAPCSQHGSKTLKANQRFSSVYFPAPHYHSSGVPCPFPLKLYFAGWVGAKLTNPPGAHCSHTHTHTYTHTHTHTSTLPSIIHSFLTKTVCLWCDEMHWLSVYWGERVGAALCRLYSPGMMLQWRGRAPVQ